MNELNVDNKQTDIAQNAYYKEIQTELRKKRDIQKKAVQEQDTSFIKPESSHSLQSAVSNEESLHRRTNHFEDEVTLAALTWEDKFLSEEDSLEKKTDKEREKLEEELRSDGKRLLRFIGQEINIQKKIPELKEMFVQTLIQSRSHNFFMSKFAKFKVGVVGQVLSAVGVDSKELMNLKKQALKMAFNENVELMAETLNNELLADLLVGVAKKKRNTMRLYAQAKNQLITQMDQIGRPGYWSSTRIIEEKIVQLHKIKDDFRNELDALNLQKERKIQERAIARAA